MREIKFRVWNKTVYPDRLEYTVVSLNDTGWININSETNSGIDMFTGLKDKHGRDIYIGDIVRAIAEQGHRDCTTTSDVILGDDLQIQIRSIQGYEHGLPLTWGGWESLEVVGNIHENSELLTN